MTKFRLRTVLLYASILAVLMVPALAAAQKPGTAPATNAAPLEVTAPSWQKGTYWANFDHLLMVDYGDLAHFHDADLKLGPPAPGEDRVVFMGDSITEGWNLQKSFPGKPYINRGISGQTSSQMLFRYRQDVIDLKPKVVMILAGTNDLAENTGPVTLEQIEGNLASMAELAKANGIRAVLCSVLPAVHYWWHPQVPDPAQKIVALNKWMKAFAAKNGYVYVDYYSPMVNAAGGLLHKYSPDGVHPYPAGYAVMASLAEAGIQKALK